MLESMDSIKGHHGFQSTGFTLGTTSIEETWDPGSHMYFLGKWCLQNSHRKIRGHLNYSIAPYHWDDRRKLAFDVQQLTDLYESILPTLTDTLNELHDTNQSIQYWRILIGHWALYFIQVLFDRWTSLRNACSLYPDIKFRKIVSRNPWPAAQDFVEFNQQASGEVWNERLYADLIIEGGLLKPQNIETVEQESPPVEIKHGKSFKTLVRNGLKWVVKRNPFTSPSLHARYFFHEASLKPINQFLLLMRLRERPYLTTRVKPVNCPVDPSFRAWKIRIPNQEDVFQQILCKLLPKYMPAVYLEGYHLNVAKANSLHWPKSPEVLFSSVAFNSNDIWKFYASAKVELGSRLVLGQHGGHYGTGAFSAMQSEEIAIADKYLTWGWQASQKSNVVPAPATKLIGLKRPRKGPKSDCLLVTATEPLFSGWLYSVPIGPQWDDHLQDQLSFTGHLREDFRKNLIVRGSSDASIYDLEKLFETTHPTVRIDSRRRSFLKSLGNVKLVVSSYNGCVFLETFSMGVPTVLFWDPTYSELNADAAPYFEDLRAAGLLYDDAVSCATFVNDTWETIDEWWGSKEVQASVNNFLEHFGFLGLNPIKELATQIRQVP